MEEKISFERFLYEGENEIIINDMEFCVDRIINLPKFHPHKLEKAVDFSIEYCRISDFRRKILEKSNKCPVLIYQLYKRDIFDFNEIKPVLLMRNAFILCYYFRKEIYNFEDFIQKKAKKYGIDFSFLNNESDIDQLIETGFLPISIEYCLKYDVIDDLKNFQITNSSAKWSPFEWSSKPTYLDFLSFSGFFGSIKCFKYLLMNGLEINENVISMVVCSGCFDLFHLCQGHDNITTESLSKASEFCHLPLIIFLLEHGVDCNPIKYEEISMLL